MLDLRHCRHVWRSGAVAGALGLAAIHVAAVAWMARAEIVASPAAASPAGQGRAGGPSSSPGRVAVAATARVPGTGGAARAAGALEAVDVDVFPGHPRLIVGGFRGTDVAALRAACQRPELRAQCEQIGGRHVLDDAMRFLLAGDDAAAERAAGALRAWGGCTAAGSDAEHADGGGMALAFDWVWGTVSPAERAAISDKLIACGAAVAEVLDGNGPHLWHGYTSLAASLALMGLAADDRSGRAGVRDAMARHFRRNALEAYAVAGGRGPRAMATCAATSSRRTRRASTSWTRCGRGTRPSRATTRRTRACSKRSRKRRATGCAGWATTSTTARCRPTAPAAGRRCCVAATCPRARRCRTGSTGRSSTASPGSTATRCWRAGGARWRRAGRWWGARGRTTRSTATACRTTCRWTWRRRGRGTRGWRACRWGGSGGGRTWGTRSCGRAGASATRWWATARASGSRGTSTWTRDTWTSGGGGRWHWTRGCTRAGDRSTARRSTCARWRTTRCWCRARARCSRGIRAARAA